MNIVHYITLALMLTVLVFATDSDEESTTSIPSESEDTRSIPSSTDNDFVSDYVPVLRGQHATYEFPTFSYDRDSIRPGLNHLPAQAEGHFETVHHADANMMPFDYTLPAAYRRMHSAASVATRTFKPTYMYSLSNKVVKHYAGLVDQKVALPLYNEGVRYHYYLFDGEQAMMLHKINAGLRAVSVNMKLGMFEDPIEATKLRDRLQTAFDTVPPEGHPQRTYPEVLHSALKNIRQEQMAHIMYLGHPDYFEDMWRNTFPFLRDPDPTSLVVHYLHLV